MDSLSQQIDKNIARVADFPSQGFDHFMAQCGLLKQRSDVFVLNALIAQKLDLPFVLVRKQGKLPPPTISESYALEYGHATIEVQPHYIVEGQRFLVHDDVLATGGTAEATAKLIEKCGGKVAQFSFIADLAFLNGQEKLQNFSSSIQTLVTY